MQQCAPIKQASTTVVKGGGAGGICPDECNYGSGQGTCDLETGTCMCCPGFSGDSCDSANLEKRCSGTATYGIGALSSESNCFNTVLEGEQVEGEECGYVRIYIILSTGVGNIPSYPDASIKPLSFESLTLQTVRRICDRVVLFLVFFFSLFFFRGGSYHHNTR